MKHTLLWFGILSNIVLLNLESAIAETLLKGQVTLRNKNGEPVEHAQISAIIGSANPVSTNSDGVFELTFLDKQPGENVRFGCVKSGFEVANKLDLQQRLSAHPDDDMAQIVVCPAEEFLQCATAYYETVFGHIIQQSRKAEREKIEQEYNDKLRNAEERVNDKDELVKTQQELLNAKNARIAELEEQNKGLQAQSAEWARQYAKYDPAVETDEMYAEALRLFQDNKLDDAIAVLDDAKIQADLQREKTKAANRFRLKAQSYIAKFDFANAEKYYQLAIDADPENFDNLFEFAYYLREQNQFLQSQSLFEKALKLAKDERETALTLNDLGVLHGKQNQYDQAAAIFQRVLKIYEDLAIVNPQTYRPGVAETLNHLGILYWYQNAYEKATDAYERALHIYEEFATTNPQTYRPSVAKILNNLGILYRNQNAYDKADEAYNQALQIREELAAENPSVYQPHVATTLNNVGVLYWDTNQYDKAAKVFERALQIREELASANPQAYEIDLCETLISLDGLYKAQFEHNSQPKYLTKGLELAERAIGILQKYSNIPRAQDYLEDANDLKAFFEQAGE